MKGSELAVAIIVILVTAGIAGGMLTYFKNNPKQPYSGGQPSSNPPSNGGVTTSPPANTPTYSTEGFQEAGSVSSVDSGGGHYSITNAALGNPLVITLSQSQLSQVHYGEDFQVQLTYSPSQQALLSTFGKAISVSANTECTTGGAYSPGPCMTIALIDADFPSAIPSSWNPQVGGAVMLSLTPETGTPLVAITGVQFSSSGSQASAEALEPSCLAQYYGTGACVMIADGQSLTIEVTISGPSCYGSCDPSSISVSDLGFTVTGFGPVAFPDSNITLSVPNTDFVGNIHLTLVYSSS